MGGEGDREGDGRANRGPGRGVLERNHRCPEGPLTRWPRPLPIGERCANAIPELGGCLIDRDPSTDDRQEGALEGEEAVARRAARQVRDDQLRLRLGQLIIEELEDEPPDLGTWRWRCFGSGPVHARGDGDSVAKVTSRVLTHKVAEVKSDWG